MGGYVCVYLEKRHDKANKIKLPGVTHLERKQYLDSLTYDAELNKLGSITEFNNEIGFSQITSVLGSGGKVVPQIIKVEDDFKLPETILLDSLHVVFSTYGIVEFEIPIKDVICKTDRRFSYDTEVIAERFVSYLRFRYDELDVTMVKRDKAKRRYVTSVVLDYFYQILDFNEPKYTALTYIPRLLSDDEIRRITEFLRGFVKYPFYIKQYQILENNHNGTKNKYKYAIEVKYC